MVAWVMCTDPPIDRWGSFYVYFTGCEPYLVCGKGHRVEEKLKKQEICITDIQLLLQFMRSANICHLVSVPDIVRVADLLTSTMHFCL